MESNQDPLIPRYPSQGDKKRNKERKQRVKFGVAIQTELKSNSENTKPCTTWAFLELTHHLLSQRVQSTHPAAGCCPRGAPSRGDAGSAPVLSGDSTCAQGGDGVQGGTPGAAFRELEVCTVR